MKFEDVKAGDKHVTDVGHTCMVKDEIHRVYKDREGHLYLYCREGRHYLNGQVGENDELIGLERRI